MPTTRNKDGELWDPATGFVYDDEGSVLRPGHRHEKPLTKTQAIAEVEEREALHPELYAEDA